MSSSSSLSASSNPHLNPHPHHHPHLQPHLSHSPPHRRHILLTAFDMFTPSHISFGQWRRPEDRSSSKRRDLSYWTDLAQLLERGGITALVLADGLGLMDTFAGRPEGTIRTGCQFPVGDPVIPISAMAAVTRNLGFIISSSTSYEKPYIVARRFSTLDHLTNGRFGWNIVTSFNERAARAVGVPYVEHDQRYRDADDYMSVLYKLWEGSWADDALNEDPENEIYTDPSRVRWIKHSSPHFTIDAPHIVDPSPQRTPFLMQAGTSAAGIYFAGKHAESVLVSGLSPYILAPRIAALRAAAKANNRAPESLKILAVLTPIVGATDLEAQAKFKQAMDFASIEGGMIFYSGHSGIDLSQFSLDEEVGIKDVSVQGRVHSITNGLRYQGADVPKYTPRNLGKLSAIGGNGAVPVGSVSRVVDIMEDWIRIAGVDGFCIGSIVSPGSFIDLVELLVPELRRRGLYPEMTLTEPRTLRERFYGVGERGLKEEHCGAKFKFDQWEPTEAEYGDTVQREG